MSVKQLQDALISLTAGERRKIAAFLAKLEREEKLREEIARRHDDRDPRHWHTLEEFEARTSPK